MTLAMASTLISPTHYMTAFLRERGWRLPPDKCTLPSDLILLLGLMIWFFSQPQSESQLPGASQVSVEGARSIMVIILKSKKYLEPCSGRLCNIVEAGEAQRACALLRTAPSSIARDTYLCHYRVPAVNLSLVLSQPCRPLCRLVIPNVVPPLEAAGHPGSEKEVWRLAFFSRLEERKGLKLFIEAVNRITRTWSSSRCLSLLSYVIDLCVVKLMVPWAFRPLKLGREEKPTVYCRLLYIKNALRILFRLLVSIWVPIASAGH